MSLFDDALGVLHATCDAWFAADAVFRPVAGAAVSGVKVERFLPEHAFGLEHAKAVVADETLKVLKAALPKRPAKGDVFEIGARDYRVLATPETEDDDGLRYTIKVERA